LEERFNDLQGRYAKDGRAFGLLEELKKATFAIENKIFSILMIDPNNLQSLQLERDR